MHRDYKQGNATSRGERVQFESANLGNISLSPSVAIQTRALELRAAGEDVLALSAGEPDFDTPRHIGEAAARAIAAGRTRYTAVDGIPELKEAVRHKFLRDNRLEFAQDEVSVSAGGKQAIYNALVASLDPGDEVVITAPYWVSYPDMVALCGGRPVAVGTSAADGFQPDPGRLEAAIGPRTRWLILNSPGNPSGAVLSEETLGDIARFLERHALGPRFLARPTATRALPSLRPNYRPLRPAPLASAGPAA